MPMRFRAGAFFFLSLLAACALARAADGQAPNWYRPQHQAYMPPPLWVKFAGPKGMQVTFYRSSAKPSTLTAPFVIAMRPGFMYRVRLSNIPNHPGLVLHPTVEVRGSLPSQDRFKAKDYPAALVFTNEDFHAASEGAYLTRVVALERRSEAVPFATSADDPWQISVDGGADPVIEAGRRGLPFLIVRIGQRQVNEAELQKRAIPGTIWLPGDKTLPPPAVTPFLPWACPSLYDPLYGPASLWPDICLPDGGDSRSPAGHDGVGRLQGLDPADTLAEYTDAEGQRRIAVSNRVCICVPRFLVFRSEVNIGKRHVYLGPGNVQLARGHAIEQSKIPTMSQHQNFKLDGVDGRWALSMAETIVGASVFGQVDGIDMVVQLEGTRGLSSVCKTREVDKQIGRPLKIIKWPDKNGASIGNVITFTLKYVNEGGLPVQNIVISDNLTTRFEYVPGSAKTDRPANFTTQPSDAGSSILRWELVDPLPAGQSGMVTFQVRVR